MDTKNPGERDSPGFFLSSEMEAQVGPVRLARSQ